MRSWEARSIEEANLFNPAFVGLICSEAIKEYCKAGNKEAPYQIPFVIAPLILHKKTRESLPSRVSKTFVAWVSSLEGTGAKMTYAEHAKALVPVVKESLIFSIINESISISSDGNLTPGPKIIKTLNQSSDLTDEVLDCFRKSAFCGRWFASAGKVETVMALLGIKP